MQPRGNQAVEMVRRSPRQSLLRVSEGAILVDIEISQPDMPCGDSHFSILLHTI